MEKGALLSRIGNRSCPESMRSAEIPADARVKIGVLEGRCLGAVRVLREICREDRKSTEVRNKIVCREQENEREDKTERGRLEEKKTFSGWEHTLRQFRSRGIYQRQRKVHAMGGVPARAFEMRFCPRCHFSLGGRCKRALDQNYLVRFRMIFRYGKLRRKVP